MEINVEAVDGAIGVLAHHWGKKSACRQAGLDWNY